MADRLFAEDGTPNEERFASMRPGDLLNELEDRRAALVAAKEADDGSAAARKRRKTAAVEYDRFRSYQRANDPTRGNGPGVAAPETTAAPARSTESQED